MQQDFKSVSDHFAKLRSKGLRSPWSAEKGQNKSKKKKKKIIIINLWSNCATYISEKYYNNINI